MRNEVAQDAIGTLAISLEPIYIHVVSLLFLFSFIYTSYSRLLTTHFFSVLFKFFHP